MIARLVGQLVEKNATSLVIDIGGVGYEVQVAPSHFESATLGSEVKAFIYDHLRETSHELFGFSDISAKQLFEQLISVSGVGPKMGLAILALGDAAYVRGAIAAGDSAAIQRASGVGKRLAERIVVDLKDKVGPASYSTGSVVVAKGDDALDGLVALGYSAQQAVDILQTIDASKAAPERIRLALQQLGSL